MITECLWREHGIRPGGSPAASWGRGRLLGFVPVGGEVRAVIATDAGYLILCELSNVEIEKRTTA
jgi:hypothetical protein